ncbi:MAG: (Fe-S)-binding protein, partial [Gammaproteobacteria bacterium]
ALTQKYGGLLWGEHGKGIRSHYAPAFFGELYPQLCRIKAAFDPYNQLNPGKIAAPRETDALLKIDRVATRGRNDRLIGKDAWQSFNEAVYCNGNAACFDWNPDAVMCPSWKATRERRYSPKGRASLLREWLKQAGEKGYSPADDLVRPTGIGGVLRLPGKLVNSLFDAGIDRDFSHRVYDSMAHCLACQSCTGQCPVKVDVPEFRAKFLYLYHTRYLRPPKDYLVGSLEFLLPVCAKFPELYNGLMQNPVIETALRKFVGFVDAPLLSPRLLHIKEIASADIERLERLSEDEKKRYVVIVQDAFTGFFEASLVADCIALLQALDFVPLMAPFSANGKPLHVHGFLHGFAKVAKNNAALLKTLADTGVALVGIDPAMTLCYRNEYVKYLGAENVPEVMLLQEFLNANSDRLATRRHGFRAGTFKLMPHCMEMSRAADSLQHWQHVFGALGQQLEVLKLGCCGMSGTFGHETRNRTLSQKVYDLSWQPAVERYRHEYTLVATGFSCRSQVERQAGLLLPHPLQALLALLKP